MLGDGVSRHRRQRNRRWRCTLGRVDKSNVLYGKRVWEEHGKVSTILTPLERIVVEQWVQKESLRRWNIQGVYAGVMVMIPIGHIYWTPEQLERRRAAGLPRIKSITVNKITLEKKDVSNAK